MIDFNIKKSPPKKRAIQPASYQAIVDSVEWAKGYREGDAFEVSYTLTDGAGKQFPYKELFYYNDRNARTVDFLDYLSRNDIENLNDFIGCREILHLLKRVKNNQSFLTIDCREFLGSGSNKGAP